MQDLSAETAGSNPARIETNPIGEEGNLKGPDANPLPLKSLGFGHWFLPWSAGSVLCSIQLLHIHLVLSYWTAKLHQTREV